MRRIGICLAALSALLAAGGAPGAEEQKGAAGYWTGRIDMPPAPLEIQVELAQSDEGWTGVFDALAAGIRNLPLERISVEGNEVRFAMQGAAGNPRFSGTLAEDGNTIEGTMAYFDKQHPFQLSRSDVPFPGDAAEFEPYRQPGHPGEDFTGRWLGLFRSGFDKQRLDLEIVRAADGTLSGTIYSPDRGGGALPLANVNVRDGKLAFRVPSIDAGYNAELEDEGRTMVGRWFRAKTMQPLVFRRQTPMEEPPISENPPE
jgi:hypothetical protein